MVRADWRAVGRRCVLPKMELQASASAILADSASCGPRMTQQARPSTTPAAPAALHTTMALPPPPDSQCPTSTTAARWWSTSLLLRRWPPPVLMVVLLMMVGPVGSVLTRPPESPPHPGPQLTWQPSAALSRRFRCHPAARRLAPVWRRCADADSVPFFFLLFFTWALLRSPTWHWHPVDRGGDCSDHPVERLLQAVSVTSTRAPPHRPPPLGLSRSLGWRSSPAGWRWLATTTPPARPPPSGWTGAPGSGGSVPQTGTRGAHVAAA